MEKDNQKSKKEKKPSTTGSKVRKAFKLAAIGAVGYAAVFQSLPSFNFGSEPEVDAAVAERLNQGRENSVTFVECRNPDNGQVYASGVARGEVIAHQNHETIGSVTYTDYNSGRQTSIRLETGIDEFSCRFQAGEFRQDRQSRYLVPSDTTEFLVTSRGGETLAADTASNNGLEVNGTTSSAELNWRREADGSRESKGDISTVRIVTRTPGAPRV